MSRFGSLRIRLVMGVLALTALGLVLAATAGTLLLRSYLVSQVDRQLQGVARFAEPGSPQPTPPATRTNQRPLPSPFVLTRLDADGVILSEEQGSQVTSALPDVAGITVDQARALGTKAFDVTGVGDASVHYRSAVAVLADGSGTVVQSVSMESIDQTVQRATLASLAVGLLTLGLVGLLAGFVIRIGLRPLDEVEATAERIAAGDLSQRVPDMPEGTEIGRLSVSLNGMLAQIENAFDERSASEERLRRFVADASHELRTPLTTIRGYAELSRNGAITAEADRLAAIARIEGEAVRMGVLVDDLLLLARLDQQRPLERRHVDVVELVDDSAAGLRAAAPDRVVTVVAPDSAIVVGDAARLRQVVDNLLTNARVYTTPGSPVGVVVTEQAAGVHIVVTDSGPGMSPDDLARATERFYRGDPSRTRRSGAGSGLGLSIVDAIVTAHEGTLRVESSPEAGTTVTVDLPLTTGAAASVSASATSPTSTTATAPSASTAVDELATTQT
jgi:two-component system OmpR family sensor kinase